MKEKVTQIVVKDNKIIEASYALTLIEQRLILACIAQINSKEPLSDRRAFMVTASGIDDLIGSQNAYRDLKNAARSLYNRSIQLDSENDEMRWLSRRAYYSKNEGQVTLYFSQDIIPYLSQLSERFTCYKLKDTAKFRSNYAIRMYELLMQWISVGEREIGVEWLRNALFTGDKYSAIKDFKRHVITPALNDINTHSNLWVKFGQRKRGRTITHFQFQFGLKEEKITEQQITKAAQPGESKGQVISRLKEAATTPSL